MPRHCSAGGCKSRDNRETRNAGITFHKLPKGEARRTLWITNSHRADSWDPQTDFVYFCSKHFTAESFELTGCSGIRRLKEDAFPTVFDFSSATKCKRAATLQKQEDVPVRTSPQPGRQRNTQQDTNQAQAAQERPVQTSVAVAEETHEDILVSSQEPSEVEQLSQQEHSPSPPQYRPLSPSCYMRRLPRPVGSYLSKEHSYAQHCPLLWRRRYDQAVDCLEKALRQLHAARRRENRLRSTVLRLRDKRPKHTLLVSRDGYKNRESWTAGGQRRPCLEGSDLGESATDARSENTEFFEDKCGNQELGCHFLPVTSSWSEEEKGYCFYCGRGQVQIGGQEACRTSETWSGGVQPTACKSSVKIQRRVETRTCGTAAEDMQLLRLDRLSGKNVESSNPDVTASPVLFQSSDLQYVSPAGGSLPDAHEQRSQLQDLQHQLLWIQNSAEGQVILVPVSADDGLQSFFTMDAEEAQTTLVSELDPEGSVGDMAESGGSLSRAEAACDECSNQHCVNSTSVEREDVREKLKEHLEGFHLQLSTEFTH